MVFYRKYRPQTISELDLTTVREKLTAILSSKELPHAFLFTGPKGLGKTSAARILAKAINCTGRGKGEGERGKSKKDLNPSRLTLHVEFEPCNKCMACVSITNGSNIDVLEIDAASNGGVEEIRALRERVKFASSTLRKKVYIIDEVHMMSTGAFNALLKTLEEPPSHVVFVLATTELWKLPPTVVSRTFQVQFEKPTEEELSNSLKRIIKGEDLKVEDGVLSRIYALAEGSFRDGAKILEELVLVSDGKEITKDSVEKTFKTKGILGEVCDLLTAYEKRDAKMALEIINNFAENGADFKMVIERLVDHLRGLLMLRNGIESEEKDVPGLNVSNIKDLLTLANVAYGELRISVIPQLPLELMTVEFCVLDAKQNHESGIKNQESQEEKVEQKLRQDVPKPVILSGSEGSKTNNDEQTTNNDDILPSLVLKLNETNKPGAALLRSCRDAVLKDLQLIITTPFPIHAERLRSEKVFGDLQKAAESLLEKSVEVVVKILPN